MEVKKSTLCWSCAKACGGCSWSDGSFTPVEGWKAEPTKLISLGKEMDSFLVLACPLYERDTDQYKYYQGEARWY